MVFNDTSTKNGLIQDCEILVFNEYGSISENTDLLYTFTNLLNRQYEKAISIIIEKDGNWQHDDNTYTSTMTNLSTLTSGQWKYTFDPEHLKLLSVRIKPNGSSSFVQIEPTNRGEEGYPDFGGSQTGQPTMYDKEGDLLKLFPTPNYTQAESIEIVVQRVPNYFAYDDTTKEAGISKLHHRFLSLGASVDYAAARTLGNKNDLMALFQEEKLRMEESYSRRNRDERTRFLASNNSTR